MTKMKVFGADVILSMIESLSSDYENLMQKHMRENNTEKVREMQQAIIALGILEDRVLDLPPMMVDVDI